MDHLRTGGSVGGRADHRDNLGEWTFTTE